MEVLPYYLAIGMPYDQFWYGDPRLVETYRKTNELRKEQTNSQLWLQGLYNFKAFRSVIEAFAYGLSSKKGTRPENYPQEPIPFTENEKRISEERARERVMRKVDANQ